MKNSESILQEKVKEHEFPFNPQDWKQMEALLKQRGNSVPSVKWHGNLSKRLRNGIFLLAASLSLAVLLVGKQLMDSRKNKLESSAKTEASTLSKAKERAEEQAPFSEKDVQINSGNAAENQAPTSTQSTENTTTATAGKPTLSTPNENSVSPSKALQKRSDAAKSKQQNHPPGNLPPRQSGSSELLPDLAQQAGGAAFLGNDTLQNQQPEQPAEPQDLEIQAENDLASLPPAILQSIEFSSLPPHLAVQAARIKTLKNRAFHCGILAGGGAMQMDLKDLSKWSLSSHFGLWASYSLGDRVSLLSGLQLKWVGGYDSLDAQFSGSGSDPFGHFSSWSYDFSTTKLVFVEMPLALSWHSKKLPRLHFLGGMRGSWVSPHHPAVNIDISNLRNRGTGLRKLDLGILYGLDYRLNAAWSLSCQVGHGLLDISHDNFYSRSDNNTNSDIQLSLKLKIY